MASIYEICTLAACIGAGLIAGLCFAFAAFIMRALDKLEPAEAIRSMQSINTEILRSSAMVVWFGTAALGVAACVLAEARPLPIAATALYVLGALFITRFGNIPLNNELDSLDPKAADAAIGWQRYRKKWSRWNNVRTVVCTFAAATYALAT